MTTKSATDQKLANLLDAAYHLADVFSDSWTARQVGGAMTCQEADAMRHMIAQVDLEAAGRFIIGHANGETEGDEPSDLHYHLRDDFHADQPHYFAGEEDYCMGCGAPDTSSTHLTPQ